MIITTIISLLTFLCIVLSVLFFPKFRIKKVEVESYWVVALLGALSLLIFGSIDPEQAVNGLFASGSMNPIKILVLFMSMSMLSIFLDEVGFFRYVAGLAHEKSKGTQTSLFVMLYFVIAVLTVFTSNDIIILTFTPFICSFARRAKINPIPYLVAEFVAANTWSMILIIGNPTNIYLGSLYNITFFEYMNVMLVPGVLAGLTSFVILYWMFRKDLKKPILKMVEPKIPLNKVLVTVGLIHLGLCTILLAISSYLGFEMWLITLIFAVSLFLWVLIYNFVKKRKQVELLETLKRTPWSLIPFVISMFLIVVSLDNAGITEWVGRALGEKHSAISYGISSFVASNFMNNIPMSVFFASVLEGLSGQSALLGVYATIIGSNLGAIFTPIGALAGIMWMSILKEEGVEYGFMTFVRKQFLVSLTTLAVSIASLMLMIYLLY